MLKKAFCGLVVGRLGSSLLACAWCLGVSNCTSAQTIKEVRIDLNSKSMSSPAPNGSGGQSSLAVDDELTSLRKQVVELQLQLAAQLERSKIATALATVTLESDGATPLSLALAGSDQMELLNVKFMNAVPTGFLHWNAINRGGSASSVPGAPAPALSGQAATAVTAANETPSPKENAEEKGQVENGGNSISLLPKVNGQEDYKATVKVKDGRVFFETVAPMSPALPMSSALGALDAPQSDQVLFEGNGLITYQQPILPWKMIYQREEQTLRQWVHYANFTGHPWTQSVNILISDRDTLGPDAILKFNPVAELPAGKSAIQRARSYTIAQQKYSLELIAGKSNATQVLILENAEFLPAGEFRAGFQPYDEERKATPIKANTLHVGIVPKAFGKASSWNEPQSYEVCGFELGVFQIKSLRKSSFSLHNDEGAGSVSLKKKADGWTVSSPWQTNDEGFHVIELSAFANETIDLFEEKISNLDFYNDDDFKELSKIVKSWGDVAQASHLTQVLALAVRDKLTIVANEKAVEAAKPELDKLTQQYDNLERSSDPQIDIAIRNTLRSLWERKNALSAKISALQSQNEVLKVQIRAALFSGSSSQL